MKLTETEKQAVRNGDPIQFQDGDVWCVVLRADLYEQSQEQDPPMLAPEVLTTMVDDTMADYDANDPLLDSYQGQAQ